jgi:hypothetical protein
MPEKRPLALPNLLTGAVEGDHLKKRLTNKPLK